MTTKFIGLLLLLLILLPVAALASVGVGVNLGKISIDEPLKAGGIYNFPSIGVLNTGDEAGDYEFTVTFHEDQPEMRPAVEWFSFTPAEFHLEAGQSQSVAVQLALPVNTRPGDYFAFLEAHPVVKSGPGTTIGVAAATKANFTVAPSNVFQAVIWRIATFFSVYSPWSYVVLAVAAGAVVIVIFRRSYSFQIGIKKKE